MGHARGQPESSASAAAPRGKGTGWHLQQERNGLAALNWEGKWPSNREQAFNR